jgi:hypothetical protein
MEKIMHGSGPGSVYGTQEGRGRYTAAPQSGYSYAMRFKIFVTFMLTFPVFCQATHLKGGYIRVERLSEASLRYRVTLHIFTSTSGVSVGGAQASLDL